MHEPEPPPLPLAVPAIERLRLMHYIEHRIQNPGDANALTQEILERALQAKSPQLIDDPIKYLYGIARQVICDFTRAGANTPGVIFDSNLAVSTAEQSPDAVPDTRAAEETLAAQIDSELALERAIEHLPSTHRRVLLMTSRDGRSYEQTAMELDMAVDAVKKYAHQARARLRMRLDRTHSPGEGEGV
jgi:RNA polymerase sigma factor (sigma-70 family)